MTAPRTKTEPIKVTQEDVESEIARLFGDRGQTGLVIRVHGDDSSSTARSEAFRELLDSLEIYEYHRSGDARGAELTVEPPDAQVIASALSVLAKPELERRLFERVLFSFGRGIVDPLGEILDTAPQGPLLSHMARIRAGLLRSIDTLKLTRETRSILVGDLEKLLSDDYLTMLADHEETVQRPLVAELAREILHLIGVTFERAFRQWPDNARTIADSVTRRMGPRIRLRESPMVIRERIVEAVQEYLWIETSTELSGALSQLFGQPRYRGIADDRPPDLDRDTYRQFAEACWDIIAENC